MNALGRLSRGSFASFRNYFVAKTPKTPLRDVIAFLDKEGNFMYYGSAIKRVKVFSRKNPDPVAGYRRAIFRPNLEAEPCFYGIVDARTGSPAGAEALGVHTQYDAPCYLDTFAAMRALIARHRDIQRCKDAGYSYDEGAALTVAKYGFVRFVDASAVQAPKLTAEGFTPSKKSRL